MKMLIVALVAFAAIPAVAKAEITWSGSTGLREVIQNFDDGLASTDANGVDQSKLRKRRIELRSSLGAFGKGDMVDWGFEVRTQPAGNPTSEWEALQQNQDRTPFGIGQAYGRLRGSVFGGDWAVTVGRQKPVFLYDNVGQSLLGNSVRWDGFGESYKMGMFGLNLAQYVQGATSQGAVNSSSNSQTDSSQSIANTQSHFAILYVFQPFVEFKITDSITEKFAVGYHMYDGSGASSTAGFFQNAIHSGNNGIGAFASATNANTSANAVVGNEDPVVMDNPRQLQLLSDTQLPMDFRFVAEYVHNKAVNYGTRANVVVVNPVAANQNALGLSLVYGKPKKAGDFLLQYSYTNKGIASVLTAYSNSDVGADNISHMFLANYLVADGLGLTGKVQWHKEKAGLDGTGQPLAAPNNNRLEKQTRIEFFASVTY
jgi:hypothetical protein